MSGNSTPKLIMSYETTKRKRGRPSKNDNRNIDFPTSHLTDLELKELLLGYRLLKDILAISKIKLLLNEPDENLFGQHDYYTVIDKPMWFNEISRKYTSMEYRQVKQVVDDIRQVLENTYVFWGIKNKLGKLAYKIEKIVDNHISEFPKDLKKICSLGMLEKPTVINRMDYEMASFVTEEYHSKMLEIIAKKEECESDKEIIIDPVLKKWEHEVLTTEENAKEIRILAELPEIGHFIKLSSDILGLNDVTQYEVERMLLMPKESTTLATIMTRLLCPTPMIGNLHLKPIMMYDVWTSFLKDKLKGWYTQYLKTNNKLQIFSKYGIEPYFWETLGEQNPLTDCDFHSLNLSKKACILKALCTTMFHSNKKIEDLFNCVSGEFLRGETIFRNNKFTYISLFGSETRVYRVSNNYTGLKHMIETIASNCEDASFVEDQLDISNQPDNQNSLSCTNQQQFYMIASNKESLKMLLTKKKKSFYGIHNLLKRDESDKFSLKGLKAMYTQWQKSLNRSTSVIENSINYWLKKETENTSIKSDVIPDTENQKVKEVLGKRVSKKKFLQDVESSSNEEHSSEETISDWETDIKRRRIKPVKAVPRLFDKKCMTSKQSLDTQKISTSVTPTVLHPEPPKTYTKINYTSRSGVRITRLPNYLPRRTIVDAAIENAKRIPFDPSRITDFLIIDMKSGTCTSQTITSQEQYYTDPYSNTEEIMPSTQHATAEYILTTDMNAEISTSQTIPFQDPFLNCNQMPVMTDFDDTNDFHHFSVYDVNNSIAETDNNQIIPNLCGENLVLPGFQQTFRTENNQSQYDPEFFISDPSNEIMAMPFMDTSDQALLNFSNGITETEIQDSLLTFNEHQTL